jgi:hypothetical protein
MPKVKGFKVFNPDWTAKHDFKYEVGKTYETDEAPIVCNRGFHFCKKAVDCFNYYSFDPDNKVAEIIAIGGIDEEENGTKCATNKIKIVREIPWSELLELVNTGKGNSGYRNSGNGNSGNGNSGDWNSGDWNSGYRNSGYRNSGNGNSGDWNSGDWNSGDWNSGYRNSGNGNSGNGNSGNGNSGDWNSGDWNSGYRNSGYRNSGNGNSGDWNSGYRNSGYRNSGYRNSGDWNSGDFNLSNNNSGCFNTKQHKLLFFDRPAQISFEEWRRSDAYSLLSQVDFRPAEWVDEDDMTDVEKAEHTEYETTGGYLKKNDLSNVYAEWWGNINDRQKQVIQEIPNFDAEKFEQITGIKA